MSNKGVKLSEGFFYKKEWKIFFNKKYKLLYLHPELKIPQ